MVDLTLKQYWDQLDKHDWTFEYSDDHGAWTRGRASLRSVVANSRQGAEYLNLYIAFREWALGPDRTADKPETPPLENGEVLEN